MAAVGARPRSAGDGAGGRQLKSTLSKKQTSSMARDDDAPVLKTYSTFTNGEQQQQKSAGAAHNTPKTGSDSEDARQVQYYKFFVKGSKNESEVSGGERASSPTRVSGQLPTNQPSPKMVKGIKFYRMVSSPDMSDDDEVKQKWHSLPAKSTLGGVNGNIPVIGRSRDETKTMILPLNGDSGPSRSRSPKSEMRFVILSTPSPTESYKFFTKPAKGEKKESTTPTTAASPTPAAAAAAASLNSPSKSPESSDIERDNRVTSRVKKAASVEPPEISVLLQQQEDASIPTVVGVVVQDSAGSVERDVYISSPVTQEDLAIVAESKPSKSALRKQRRKSREVKSDVHLKKKP